MEAHLSPKPVIFRWNEYLNQGFELFKKNIGTFVLSFLLTLLLSIIPFCSFLAVGNFMKICRKISRGEKASASEVFMFDDFWPFLKLLLVIVLALVVIEVPAVFLVIFLEKQENIPAVLMFFLILAFIGLLVVLYYLVLKAYYMIPLIALENIRSIREAWKISGIMTHKNLLKILLFSILASFIGHLGMLACIVGLIFTLPLVYVMQYVSYEEGLQQIKKTATAEPQTATE